MKIGGIAVMAMNSITDDINIEYSLYKELSGDRGIIQVFDNDGCQAISTKIFPNFADAKKIYDEEMKNV